ncbi:MAG TPA: DUF5615 family PIN-like protein [Candidatus Binatia bacterium]|nr:DUF5615 family PIN-like protein [Candidatus Binatia bacterium]
MKLLLDQGVPHRAAALLREAGVEAVHTAEVGPSTAEDRAIITWCLDNGAVAVTLDADFHAWIALSGATAPSVVRIRMQGLKGPEMAGLLLEIIRTRSIDLTAGVLLTAQHGRLRVHRLPIGARSA